MACEAPSGPRGGREGSPTRRGFHRDSRSVSDARAFGRPMPARSGYGPESPWNLSRPGCRLRFEMCAPPAWSGAREPLPHRTLDLLPMGYGPVCMGPLVPRLPGSGRPKAASVPRRGSGEDGGRAAGLCFNLLFRGWGGRPRLPNADGRGRVPAVWAVRNRFSNAARVPLSVHIRRSGG